MRESGFHWAETTGEHLPTQNVRRFKRHHMWRGKVDAYNGVGNPCASVAVVCEQRYERGAVQYQPARAPTTARAA
jgi:hypothetical protein